MAWAPDYITSDDLKDYRRIDDMIDDATIEIAVTSASRAVDDHCNRQFGVVDAPEERLYTAEYDYGLGRWVVEIDDLQTAAALAIEVADVGTVDSYLLEPLNAVLKGKAWTRLVVKTDSSATPTGETGEVAVTASWGWTTFPLSVVQATMLQASRFVSRQESPYGIAGSPEAGSEMRLLTRVDPDVGVALRGYRRARRVG